MSHIPVAFWGLSSGFVLWIILYFSLPRPTRTYVLGHELTHVIWTWLWGGRASDLRVSGKGGSVKVTANPFPVTLAPYFFPFYTFCVLIIYAICAIFFDQSTYVPFWLGLVGLTWAFHLTFTISMLKEHQPDVQQHGRLFSYTIIYLLNIIGIGLWIVAVARPDFETFLLQFRADMVFTWSQCILGLQALWRLITQLLQSTD